MKNSFFKAKVLTKFVIVMMFFSFLHPLFSNLNVVRANTPTDPSYFMTNAKGNEVAITGYSGSGPKNVVIPSTIDGIIVTEIGVGAFASKGLTSVVIPDSVKTIGANAFAYNNLTSVAIPESVEKISKYAFGGNPLTIVTIHFSPRFTTYDEFGHNTVIIRGIPNTSAQGYADLLNLPFQRISTISPSTATFDKNVPNQSDVSVQYTLGDDGSTFSRITKNGIDIGSANYSVNTATGIVTIRKEYLATLAEGQHKFKFVFPYNNGEDEISFVITIIDTTPSLSSTTATFDKNEQNQADVEVTMILNGSQFTKITHNGTDLVEGNQYTRSGNKITIKKEYLASLPIGTETFKFVLENGKYELDFLITITNTTVYTVTFDSNGGSSVTPQTVQHGNKATAPTPPTREGYTFLGWYTGSGQPYDFNTPVTSDLTLYAKWEINSYTVTFDSNGGSSVTSQSVQYGNQATEPAPPTREGYTFLGWYTGSGQLYDFNTPVTSDLTLIAHWDPIMYTVTFDSNGGSSVTSQTIQHGNQATEPAPPTREGYTFLGWYTGSGQLYDFNTPVTSDLTLIAHWDPIMYTVTFDSNGGTPVSSQSVQHGNQATVPTPPPTKEGYAFLGSGQPYDFNTPVTSHLTLFARWSPNSSSGSGPGGGSSSDDSSDRSSEKITEVITIDVETGNVGEVVVNKIPLTRIRENGNVRDQLTFTPQSAQKVIKAILEAGQTTARIVIPDRKDEVSQIDFTLPKETKELFREANVTLEIYTENERIEIPSTSLNETDQDLYFRIVPMKEEAKQKEIEKRAVSIAQGEKVNVIGRPVTIETNLQNRPVTLTLPLLGVTLPADAREREQFLSELAIYIEHSDGEKELVQPQVVEYKPGMFGLQFTVDKFSTFAILQISSQAEEAVEEEEEQIQHHVPYIRGYADGTFKPEQAITRAEMAAILARNIGIGEVNAASSYPDVPDAHWAMKDIESVRSVGLMVGDDKGNFRPDAPITRGEMAAIAARYKNLDTSGFNQSTFSDVEASYWGAAAIEAVRQAGIIAGYEDGTYKPYKNVTRAEAVKIANRMFDRGPLYGVTEPSFLDVPGDHWAFYEIEEAAQEHDFIPRLEGGENLVK